MNSPAELPLSALARFDSEARGRPISEVIRGRIRDAGKRYFANDNLAEFIESDHELDALQDEVEDKMKDVLRSLVIDIDADHNTQETARRVAKMFVPEVFSGRYAPKPPVTAFPNIEQVNELMLVGPISVRSACSHHLCPIIGKLWIGVLPHRDSMLIGLSKFARLADWIMSRPQIQEEAIKNLADLLEAELRPAGLALVMDASHFCMRWRGVKDDSAMISSVMRGTFAESATLRNEFLALRSAR